MSVEGEGRTSDNPTDIKMVLNITEVNRIPSFKV